MVSFWYNITNPTFSRVKVEDVFACYFCVVSAFFIQSALDVSNTYSMTIIPALTNRSLIHSSL